MVVAPSVFQARSHRTICIGRAQVCGVSSSLRGGRLFHGFAVAAARPSVPFGDERGVGAMRAPPTFFISMISSTRLRCAGKGRHPPPCAVASAPPSAVWLDSAETGLHFREGEGVLALVKLLRTAPIGCALDGLQEELKTIDPRLRVDVQP